MKTFTPILGFAGFRRIPQYDSVILRAERDDAFNCHDSTVSRRSLFHTAGMSIAGTVSSGPLAALLRVFSSTGPNTYGVANAMGLVQFPCPPGELANTYHMMRAGESILEAEGIISTNPLFLTNREDALSELGIMQVEEACKEMLSRGINPSVVKYSLASKCIDSANIVATTLMVGRNRIVPEFTYMDQRGVGLWDGKSLHSTEAAVWAMDAAEAGEEGRGGKPPQNDDGTANETLFEQVTRLRQLMSILETQYSGDDILLIFPDGTSPALLSCLISGIPLKDVHALNFVPGELREGVDMDNARRLFAERISSPQYLKVLSKGQDELVHLRKEYEEHLLAKVGSKELLMPTPIKKKSDSLVNGEVAFEAVRRRAYGEDGGPRYSPDIFSAGALGAMGGLAMLRADKDAKEDDNVGVITPESNPGSVLAYVDSTRSSVFEPQIDVPLATSSVRTAVVNVDPNANLNVFNDVPVISKEDRIKAAELAMEEYLSQDDDAMFLASLQDIMGED